MSLIRLLRAIVRRWYIPAAALLAAAFLVQSIASADGVFQARLRLVFLPPAAVAADANALRESTPSLTHFAALVQREYTGNEAVPHFASVDAPLFGSGLRSGVMVQLPNAGGQWSSDFRDAALVVESIDPSRAVAVERLHEAVAEVQRIAEQRQSDAGVTADMRIDVLISDQTSGVRYAQGSTLRATVAIALLAAAIGCSGAVLLDRVLLRRSGASGRDSGAAQHAHHAAHH